MRRIVALTDGSERSFRVFPHAYALARATQLELAVLCVFDPVVELTANPVSASARVAERTSELEDRITRHLSAAGIPVSTVSVAIKHQDLGLHQAILESAGDLGAVVVALETRGENRLRTALVGNTALRLLARSHMPLLVTTAATEPLGEAETYRMLACTNGTGASEAVARSLTAALLDATVTLSILDLETEPPDLRHFLPRPTFERFLRWLPPHLSARELNRRFGASDGDASAEVLEAAQSEGAQAIVLSSHGFRLWQRLIGGNLAMSVVAKSPLPVIVAR